MVKQITGQFILSSPTLKELHERAMKLIEQFECFEINHVSRENNREADRLANLAIGRGIAKKAPAVGATDLGGVVSVVPEIDGVVRDGVVRFMGSPLPEGTLVKIRTLKP